MKRFCVLLAGIFWILVVHGQVRMPGIFGNHMVFQRSRNIPVWGWASPNEKIRIRFKQQKKETNADKSGKWRIELEPESAGGPYVLSILASDTLVFEDVLVGEVWLCSGQSNMEFELRGASNGSTEIKESDLPQLRQIKIPHAVGGYPSEDILPAKWEVCSPSTSGDFTAVGYFFAREIMKRLKVPVGLINSTWGGTMVETWTSRGAFEKSPEFKSMIASIPEKDFEPLIEAKKMKMKTQIVTLQSAVKDSVPENRWKEPDYNSRDWPKIRVAVTWEDQDLGLNDFDGVAWYRREITLDENASGKAVTLSLGTIDDYDSTFVNGKLIGASRNYNDKREYVVPAGIFKSGVNVIAVRVEDGGGGGGFYGDSTSVYLKTDNGILPLGDGWHFRIAGVIGFSGIGPNDYPSLLYNSMIHPLIPFGIRGCLWYQGEANADRAYQYRTAFPLMINDWRQHWGEGNFPFYFVQLASFNAGNGHSNPGSSWAELREAQTQTLNLPATGMAVTTDIGESNDIHPRNKKDVGKRLAAIALNNIYDQLMEYSGPQFDSMQLSGDQIILNFSHTGSGLVVKSANGFASCVFNKDANGHFTFGKECQEIKGLEIAGSDHRFHSVRAFPKGNQVVLLVNSMDTVQSVRYAWSDDAGEGNLFNREGFPAVPFRTDHWKGITDDIKFTVR